MGSLTIYLPNELAIEAQRKGLLDSEKIVELIKQAIEKPQATHFQKQLLQQTSGIWKNGNGLQWQVEQRQQWESDK
ncbi:MAG: hypothetical protein E6Q25_03920 [Acinetobacter sp.]|jgi:hypothetical protein|nr:MAG: hypothetical protein E6Q25_03920 [Acinetobacter sp.]